MTGNRTKHSSDFKARGALEAIKGEMKLTEQAVKLGVHNNGTGGQAI